MCSLKTVMRMKPSPKVDPDENIFLYFFKDCDDDIAAGLV